MKTHCTLLNKLGKLFFEYLLIRVRFLRYKIEDSAILRDYTLLRHFYNINDFFSFLMKSVLLKSVRLKRVHKYKNYNL